MEEETDDLEKLNSLMDTDSEVEVALAQEGEVPEPEEEVELTQEEKNILKVKHYLKTKGEYYFLKNSKGESVQPADMEMQELEEIAKTLNPLLRGVFPKNKDLPGTKRQGIFNNCISTAIQLSRPYFATKDTLNEFASDN